MKWTSLSEKVRLYVRKRLDFNGLWYCVFLFSGGKSKKSKNKKSKKSIKSVKSKKSIKSGKNNKSGKSVKLVHPEPEPEPEPLSSPQKISIPIEAKEMLQLPHNFIKKNFGPWRPNCCQCKILKENMKEKSNEPYNLAFKKLLDPSVMNEEGNIWNGYEMYFFVNLFWF